MIKFAALPATMLTAAVLVVNPALLSAGVSGNGAVSKIEKNSDKVAAVSLTDADGDGFSDLCEKEYGFDAANPASHPPLWWRLQVQNIRPVEVVRFTGLKKDKKTAEFSVSSRKKGDSKYFAAEIGDWITVKKRRFRVSSIENAAGSVKVTLTALTAKGKAPQVIELELNKPFYEYCAVLQDTGDPERREYIAAPGEMVYLGVFTAVDKNGKEVLNAAGRRALVRSYRVEKVDRRNLTVTVSAGDSKVGKGVEFEITPEGKIASDRRPLKKQFAGSQDPDRKIYEQ